MIITYFRSSSLNGWNYCQQKYFINYVLGIPEPTNAKAEYGTVCHKVLEILADCKKSIQDKGIIDIEDDIVGKIYDVKDFMEPTIITAKRALEINKSRRAATIYKSQCSVKPGDVRYGERFVDELFEKVYDYYKNASKNEWPNAYKKHTHNWTWMFLEYNNGQFDPRNQKIVSPEMFFDIPIEEDWAKYKWTTKDGEECEGQLSIKGTIDLIVEVAPNVYEVCDYKTGQRLDWATGKEKSYEKLKNDPQLMLYYYALNKKFPDIEHVLVSIIFVRDGGAFTIDFDKSHIKVMENYLKKLFDEIKESKLPNLRSPSRSDFQCKTLCSYYKDGDLCKEIHDYNKKHGLEKTIAKYKNPEHKIGFYSAPGEVK